VFAAITTVVHATAVHNPPALCLLPHRLQRCRNVESIPFQQYGVLWMLFREQQPGQMTLQLKGASHRIQVSRNFGVHGSSEIMVFCCM
jgi:hypothetical protein